MEEEEEEVLLVPDLGCPHNPQRALCWSKSTFPEGAVAIESWCWIILKDNLLDHTEGLQPRRRTHSGAWEKGEEDRAAVTNCHGLTTAHLCHPARGKVKEWNEEVTLSLAKEGVGKVLFKLIVFLARQVCFNWQSSYFFYKLNLFSCDNKWFPCPYLNPWTSSPYFFLLPCWRGWMRKGQGGCFPVSQRQSTTLPFYLRNWDAGFPTENASPGVGWPCTGDCHWDLWGPVTLSSGLSHVFSFHCTNFCWLLNGFIFLSSLWVCNSCPTVFTKPHPFLPPVPPKDHFLHLPCKTMRIKVSPCLQSQQTVCMSNKLILSLSSPFSWWSLPLLSPFDLLFSPLCCVRLSLVIGCPGLLHCMVQEAQETCS